MLDDGPIQQPPVASPIAGIIRALVALALFGAAFVLFLVAPLVPVVVICIALGWYERVRSKRGPVRRAMATTSPRSAVTGRGSADSAGSFRFASQAWPESDG